MNEERTHIMHKHKCPNGGYPAVTVWQKLRLGPLKKIRCKSCGAFISVPWLKSLMIIGLGTWTPLFSGLLALGLVPKNSGAVVAIVILAFGAVLGTLLFFWLYDRYVPLAVKRA